MVNFVFHAVAVNAMILTDWNKKVHHTAKVSHECGQN